MEDVDMSEVRAYFSEAGTGPLLRKSAGND